MENSILPSYHPWRSNSNTYFATGLFTNVDIYPKWLYRDGKSVDNKFYYHGIKNVLGSLENDTCIGLKSNEFHLIPCTGYPSKEDMVESFFSIENSGQDCYHSCNSVDHNGPCNWCGPQGL